MYLKSISFKRKPVNGGDGWAIKNCELSTINLIAGKNASGKTRLVTAIEGLARLLLRDQVQLKDSLLIYWSIVLQDEDREVVYEISCDNNGIQKEELKINNEVYFTRDLEGKGDIKFEQLNQKIEFEVDKQRIVATSKRDKKQHPFLEVLFDWANHVFLYKFGGSLGRNALFPTIELDDNAIIEQLNKDDDGVIPKFELGIKNFGDEFKNKVIQDFNIIGYSVTNIHLAPYHLPHFETQGVFPNMLSIEEEGTSDKILQSEISQGMFRVLSLIIQITYLEFFDLTTQATTILIDDIGEGLDFERSTNLIKFLVSKAEELEGKIQLVMTTNDRFVMNNVPLKYWTVVDKSEGEIQFYSQKSHPELFEEFEYIGLNNFDFFSGQYYKENS